MPYDALHARLPSFRAKAARAETVIGEMLTVARAPYVSWSGGKESTVVLHMASRREPAIAVMWSDEELVHDETAAYVTEIAERWSLALLRLGERHDHAGWFHSWTDAPFWRAPHPDMALTGTRNLTRWLFAHGYDGALLGLRKAEAAHRRSYLAAKGRLHQTALGWRGNPLAGWTVDDVWAYISLHDLPYNPVYDTLARIGVPRHEQRVGPLPLAPGWHLRAGWPDLYRRLVARYGNQWGG